MVNISPLKYQNYDVIPTNGLISHLDGADQSSFNLNGTSVVSWSCQVGGPSYTQSTGASRPTYVAASKAVRFANQFLAIGATPSYNQSNGSTTFMVAEPLTASSTSPLSLIRHSYGTSNELRTLTGILSENALIYFHARNTAGSWVGASVTKNLTNTWYNGKKSVLCGIWKESDHVAFKAQYKSAQSSTVANLQSSATGANHRLTRMGAGTAIASDAVANLWSGFIYEFLFYNRELSATEIAQVQNYLFYKWGI